LEPSNPAKKSVNSRNFNRFCRQTEVLINSKRKNYKTRLIKTKANIENKNRRYKKMNVKQSFRYLLIMALLLCSQISVLANNSGAANQSASGENVIFQWNRVLQETISTPGQHPARIFPVRSFAMMHAAMFDAVNSIDGSYAPYLIEVPGTKNASAEAAAAQAAHDVLAALYPSRQAIFDVELATSLEGIPANRARQGIRVGQKAAAQMLAIRSEDGWMATPPAYILPPTPGNWQPAPAPAALTHFPAVVPFAITSNAQFAPAPPPALTSNEYAASFNEVKEIGSAISQTRTADQTKVAQLWANVNTPTTVWYVWNNVARSVSASRGLTLAENARLFALLNISMHDALQTTMTSKFVHGLWRPVTAIRRADEDGNPNTEPDVNWSPLIGNPPYPAYAGNHAQSELHRRRYWRWFSGATTSRFSILGRAQAE
jgi:hypothetical protein